MGEMKSTVSEITSKLNIDEKEIVQVLDESEEVGPEGSASISDCEKIRRDIQDIEKQLDAEGIEDLVDKFLDYTEPIELPLFTDSEMDTILSGHLCEVQSAEKRRLPGFRNVTRNLKIFLIFSCARKKLERRMA